MICVCLAVPAKVTGIRGKVAQIEVLGSKSSARIELLKPKKGDYVLVQFGAVTEIMERKSAEESIEAWRSIIQSKPSQG